MCENEFKSSYRYCPYCGFQNLATPNKNLVPCSYDRIEHGNGINNGKTQQDCPFIFIDRYGKCPSSNHHKNGHKRGKFYKPAHNYLLAYGPNYPDTDEVSKIFGNQTTIKICEYLRSPSTDLKEIKEQIRSKHNYNFGEKFREFFQTDNELYNLAELKEIGSYLNKIRGGKPITEVQIRSCCRSLVDIGVLTEFSLKEIDTNNKQRILKLYYLFHEDRYNKVIRKLNRIKAFEEYTRLNPSATGVREYSEHLNKLNDNSKKTRNTLLVKNIWGEKKVEFKTSLLIIRSKETYNAKISTISIPNKLSALLNENEILETRDNDVSNPHILIRYDEENDQFFIKHLGEETKTTIINSPHKDDIILKKSSQEIEIKDKQWISLSGTTLQLNKEKIENNPR